MILVVVSACFRVDETGATRSAGEKKSGFALSNHTGTSATRPSGSQMTTATTRQTWCRECFPTTATAAMVVCVGSIRQRRRRRRRRHRDGGVQHRVPGRRAAADAQQSDGLPLGVGAARVPVAVPQAASAGRPRRRRGEAAARCPAGCCRPRLFGTINRALHRPPETNDNGQSFLPSTFLLLALEEATASGNEANTNRT